MYIINYFQLKKVVLFLQLAQKNNNEKEGVMFLEITIIKKKQTNKIHKCFIIQNPDDKNLSRS